MVTFRPDTSFPFLALARKHGLDYGAVIRHAESWWQSFDHPEVMPPGVNRLPVAAFAGRITVDCDILDAVVAERRRRAKIAHDALHNGEAP